MKRYKSSHMVRMEHLNHHGNLYAGQGIEWMIENSFIVVNCEYGNPQGLLYKNTHKFDFYHSVDPGDIIYYEGLIVRTGRTSLTIRVGLYDEKTGVLNAEGFTTFVTVDTESLRPIAHGITLDETDDKEEIRWREEAHTYFER
ncbi:MAG: hotdog domain-containing protein [Bacillota bacterium]|nr:hotdog domain-containing protein [Bacillota bacterium]